MPWFDHIFPPASTPAAAGGDVDGGDGGGGDGGGDGDGMVKVKEMVKEKMVAEMVTAAVAMTAAAAAMKEAHTRHTSMSAARRWGARPVAPFAGRGAWGGVHCMMLKPVRVRRGRRSGNLPPCPSAHRKGVTRTELACARAWVLPLLATGSGAFRRQGQLASKGCKQAACCLLALAQCARNSEHE